MRDYINSLIGGITHEVKRMSLEISINSMESSLAVIAKQRSNDYEAEKIIESDLSIARRKMQILASVTRPCVVTCCELHQNACNQGRGCPARKA